MQQDNSLGINDKILVAGVYQLKTNDSTIRVLCFDDVEILYEGSSMNNRHENLKKKWFYYRLPIQFFKENSKYKGTLEFSLQELKAFRPDIPLRLLRFETMDQIDQSVEGELDLNEMYLIPVTKKKSFGKPSLLKNQDGGSIQLSEIIKKAIEIKEDGSDGIGVFRLGSYKGVPLYYVGGYVDLAGYLGQ